MKRWSKPGRVVVVSHDSSRTGAPMVALLVARCLGEAAVETRVVTRTNGPLHAEYAAVAPTHRELLMRVRRRLLLLDALAIPARWVDETAAVATLLRHRPAVVYVNTSAAAVYVKAATRLAMPVVLHVHESAENTAHFLDQAEVSTLEGVHLVACSPSVRAHLVARTGRAEHEVLMVPSVPDDDRIRSLATQPGSPTTTAPDGSHPGSVGTIGSVSLRKGTDLWSRIADRVHAQPATAATEFTWIGDLREPELAVSRDHVTFAGPSANPYPAMADFTLTALTSRDDPFPLVVLESMLLGTPVVAFDVGSVRTQIGDAGIVVPAGDVDAFADAVHRVLTDDELRARLSTAATARAEELYSTRAFSRELLALVTSVVPGRG